MNNNTERFYEIAANEIATKQVVVGVMSKAFADNNGDEKRTMAAYIRLRVEQLEKESRRTNTYRSTMSYRIGRFYGKHETILFWAIVFGVILAVIKSIN